MAGSGPIRDVVLYKAEISARTVVAPMHRRVAQLRRRSSASSGLRALASVLLLGLIGTGLSACSDAAATPGSAATGGAASATTSAPTPTGNATQGGGSSPSTTSTPADDGGATGTADPPLPNPVTGTPTKALRAGQQAAPAVSAPPSGFSTPATYGDKVTLAVTKATKQVESGNGPGVFAGRDYTTFDVELTNGSSQPIDLNQVVVTTYYGATNQLAAPVYTPSAQTSDFGGSLAPGGKATARYGFAFPAAELANVTMVVDFDALHTSATFTGAVAVS